MRRFHGGLSRVPARRLVPLAGLLAGVAFGVMLLVNADAQTASRPRQHQSAPVFVSTPPSYARSESAVVRGKLISAAINRRLARSFAIFSSRPATRQLLRAHDVPSSSVRSDATAVSASFEQALLPRILKHWLDASDGVQTSGAGPSKVPTAASILGQASAQNVETLAVDGADFAVLAGTKGVCLAVATKTALGEGGFATGCASASAAASKGLSFDFGSSTGITGAVGLVPGSEPSVTVAYQSGQTASVPVVSNLYNVTSSNDAPIVNVSYTTPAGVVVSVAGKG